MLASERTPVKRKGENREVDHYGVEPSKFDLALRAYRVPPERVKDALTWAAAVCAAANEAPDAVLNEELQRLREERAEDG